MILRGRHKGNFPRHACRTLAGSSKRDEQKWIVAIGREFNRPMLDFEMDVHIEVCRTSSQNTDTE